MQDDSGLKRILKFSWAYRLLQSLAGTPQAMRWLAEHHWKAQPGEKVVDIGCGLGTILHYLPPDVNYVGFDISDAYIQTARKQFGDRAVFLCGTARTFLDRWDDRLDNADLVTCIGLLHHLEDKEVEEVLEVSRRMLSPTGRLVVLEPTYLAHQTRTSRWMVGRDRGRNVRSEAEWKRLMGNVFPSLTTSIATGLLRLPYVHILAECRTTADSKRAA